MEFAIDTRMAIRLMFAVAIIAGAILGFRARVLEAEESLFTAAMLRRYDIALVPALGYVWLVSVLAAYPSFATEHTTRPYLRFPLVVAALTIVVLYLSLGVVSKIFSKIKRIKEARERRMAVY